MIIFSKLFPVALDFKSSRSIPSKDSPSTSKERFTLKLLPSDDDTASNSSEADFIPHIKRSPTPRRQLRSSARSAEKRITRSSAKISEKLIENSCDGSCSTIEDRGLADVCDDPMKPCVSGILPDPPSPPLISELDEESIHSNEVSLWSPFLL